MQIPTATTAEIVYILAAINSAGLFVLAFNAGRYSNRVEALEKRMSKQEQSGDANIEVRTTLKGMEKKLDTLQEDFEEFRKSILIESLRMNNHTNGG